MIASQPAARMRGFFHVAPLWCPACVLILSGLTMLGWISGFQVLASGGARYIPMAPSTALCFTLLATALLLARKRHSRIWMVRGLSLAVLAVAVAKLIESTLGFGFGLDAWLVRNPAHFGAVLTGRMAPLTATSFVILAAGLAALTGKRPRHWAGGLGALTTAISLVILAGYGYGTPMLYGGDRIPVALPTAGSFLICAVGVMAAAGASAWPLRMFLGHSTRAMLLRAFIPALTALTLCGGLIRARILIHFNINPALISATSAVAITLMIIAVVSLVARKVGARIDTAEAELTLAQADLLALNAHLEQRVRDRTRELHERHEQMNEELRMARELQFALLPHEYPVITAGDDSKVSVLDFLSFFFPSGAVSGDFFSVMPLGQNAAGILICDVMGHGVRSALITGMIRVLVEEHAQTVADPGELLTRINHGLTGILKQAGATMFATCFYLVADVERQELRYANAGHPEPLRIRANETHATADWLPESGASGPAMGIFPNAVYRTITTPMEPGDVITLYTDGLFEVEDSEGDILSQDGLLAIVQRHAYLPAEQMLAQVVADVRDLSQTAAFEDDVCIVGVQFKPTESAAASGKRLTEGVAIPA